MKPAPPSISSNTAITIHPPALWGMLLGIEIEGFIYRIVLRFDLSDEVSRHLGRTPIHRLCRYP
jgi:hypothetical protein